MEVEVIWRDIVKPSKQTRDHLPYLNFSLLDQLGVPTLMPLIFFYTKPNKNQAPLDLKPALRYTLSEYFPLAGRIDLKTSKIICNDAGVPYAEARAMMHSLSQVIGKAEMADLDKLLPGGYKGFTDLMLAVQVTEFACGGVSVGVRMNSRVTDAFSFLMFVKAWASVTSQRQRNGSKFQPVLSCPNFGVATLFPPLPPASFRLHQSPDSVNKASLLLKERAVSKRFVFDRNKLSVLKSKYTTTSNNPRGTSLGMILSAIIWRSLRETGIDIPHEVFHLVNLRPRLPNNPTSTTDYFGKMGVRAFAEIQSKDREESGAQFVERMSKSLSKIDSHFTKDIQGVKGAEEYTKVQLGHSQKARKGEIKSLGFSSIRSLPVYEADFGWGKPIWVTSATLTIPNFIIFMPTRFGADIEAYVTLTEEDITKLENDTELMSYTTSGPLACKL